MSARLISSHIFNKLLSHYIPFSLSLCLRKKRGLFIGSFDMQLIKFLADRVIEILGRTSCAASVKLHVLLCLRTM